MKFLKALFVAAVYLTSEVSAQAQNPKGPDSKPQKDGRVDLKISLKSGERNKTSPLLHGLFFEDINHSGDGGIYAELIRNRAFQGSQDVTGGKKDLTGYRAIGKGVKIELDVTQPLSDALRTVMKVTVPANATGEVGFLNEGWWGIDVQPQTYNASLYIKPHGPTFNRSSTIAGLTFSLRSNLTDDIWVKKNVPFPENISTFRYTHLQTTLTPPKAAPNSNNTFAVTWNGKAAAGQIFYFNLISLFPPTYKNRPNGLRKDLAEVLEGIEPKFLRFPGGNNLEGISIDTRWQWKKNIGPLVDRPGRPGNWGYWNTDGLGYLEYLYWCEDMGIEPLLTVYAGYSLDATGINPANTVPPDELDFFIQEALDQLEYAMGDVNTTWGALRAKHGHPEPFSIKYVEIGNEDWFSDSYYWRYPRFLKALKEKYPDIMYISSQAVEENPTKKNVTIPPGNMWDLHHYQTPQFFKNNFNYFDNWQEVNNYPNVTIFVGEYSVLSRDREGGVDWANGEGRFAYPPMLAAVGEAIFALAMERNPHVVKLSSYAPLLQNWNAYQWTPNFVAFSANPKDLVRSTSYYQQALFSKYLGYETLKTVNVKGDFNPLWWHASISKDQKTVYVKVVNSEAKKQTLNLEFDQVIKAANATVMRNDDEYAFNFIGNSTIVPRPKTIPRKEIKGKKLKYEVEGWSINVVELKF
ncbi:glycoside hydrolase [Ascobolus immersus RN42]|uniref:non-reducing end alpha-L-arabinofuranosidase n=1 Tax=Ascobolus immersus RN42 TaxID=1160509 RepID=A0A3N4HZY5_ASCIM|nr:glycoside hydrolase [Ascobolus immersus RN42]